MRVAIEMLVMVVKTFPFGEGSDREVGDGSENVSISSKSVPASTRLEDPS